MKLKDENYTYLNKKDPDFISMLVSSNMHLIKLLRTMILTATNVS